MYYLYYAGKNRMRVSSWPPGAGCYQRGSLSHSVILSQPCRRGRDKIRWRTNNFVSKLVQIHQTSQNWHDRTIIGKQVAKTMGYIISPLFPAHRLETQLVSAISPPPPRQTQIICTERGDCMRSLNQRPTWLLPASKSHAASTPHDSFQIQTAHRELQCSLSGQRINIHSILFNVYQLVY